MESSYTYKCRVWQVDAGRLFKDIDFVTFSTHNTVDMIHKSRFLMLDLHQPDPLHHLVISLHQKLFQDSQEDSYPSPSDHPVPLDHQDRVILKIKNFVNSIITDADNVSPGSMQIGVSFVVRRRREPTVSAVFVPGIKSADGDALSTFLSQKLHLDMDVDV